VTTEARLNDAIREIKKELVDREAELQSLGRVVECQRLHQRTMYDVEMMKEMGYCYGIENYSRFLDGRIPNEPPHTLLDYFPEDFILFMDESHVATGQLRGMFLGDRSRKKTLVDYGFRLPSALDNRPLKIEEFEDRVNQLVFVSATPGDYELTQSKGSVVEQIVRPTGLVDPIIEVRPAKNQVDDLLEEIHIVVGRGERVLITVLTKKLAEQLTSYYRELGIKAEYLHSEISIVERVELIKNLRMGVFDVLVGINLLREGLDLPEVSLVAILDADKEGYLRSHRSLVQTIGRAARNISGKAILYGDQITVSMRCAIDETERRRARQTVYNDIHNITPENARRHLEDVMGAALAREFIAASRDNFDTKDPLLCMEEKAFIKESSRLEAEMRKLASNMNFERAAEIRDRLLMVRRERLLQS
jgi:excinuclease ABC subunit B